MDWEPILWVGGGFAGVIVILLGWIAYLIKSDRDTNILRLDKHESWIIEVQKEVRELTKSTSVAIEHNSVSIEFIKELVNKRKR